MKKFSVNPKATSLTCLALGVLLVLSATAGAAEKDADDKPAAAEKGEKAALPQLSRNTNGESVLILSPELQTRMGLGIAPVTAVERSPESKAYGAVMDPGPLVSLQGEMVLSDSSVASLKALAKRAKSLFDQDQNVSRKVMETAAADLQAAEIKAQNLHRQLTMDWGNVIGQLDESERRKLVEQLVAEKVVLARVDLPAGQSVVGLPVGARVSTLNDPQLLTATVVSGVSKIDPKTQGVGFLLKLEGNNVALRPGAAISALLQLPGVPTKGILVPNSAILRVTGKTWVWVVGAENAFSRREITLDIPTDKGWLSATGLSAGDKVVVEGGQLLLSEELKSQIQAD